MIAVRVPMMDVTTSSSMMVSARRRVGDVVVLWRFMGPKMPGRRLLFLLCLMFKFPISNCGTHIANEKEASWVPIFIECA